MGQIIRSGFTGLIAIWTVAALTGNGVAAIQGRIPIEIENDWNYASDDFSAEHNQLFTKTEPEITIRFAPGWSLFALGVLAPTRDPGPREDRAFEDHGIFVEELYARYESGAFSVKAGKFTPNFGFAWGATPGVFGSDIAEANYEFSERIGFGGALSSGSGATGRHTVSSSLFFLDTTPLYQSLGQGRAPATRNRADGGVSNTESLSSFAIALDGGEFETLPGLHYHIAHIRQARGEGGDKDERGFAIAVTHKIKLDDETTVTPLVEFVRLSDAEGVADTDRDLLTAAAALEWRDWNVALSYTGRSTDAAGVTTDDTHFQVSAGYVFDIGVGIDVAWLIDETDNVETRTIGLRLSYEIGF